MTSDVGLGGDSHEIQGPVTIRLSLIEIWWASDYYERARPMIREGELELWMEWIVKLNV